MEDSIREERCSNCGKIFCPAPEHIFKHSVEGEETKWFCKYSCMTAFQRKNEISANRISNNQSAHESKIPFKRKPPANFRDALVAAHKICGEHSTNPMLLYYALCDAIGNNLQLKPQAEAFHHFNQTCQIVETMAKDPDPRMIFTLLEKCKKQPDAPEKLCLRWIHTLFVFYYPQRTRRKI